MVVIIDLPEDHFPCVGKMVLQDNPTNNYKPKSVFSVFFETTH